MRALSSAYMTLATMALLAGCRSRSTADASPSIAAGTRAPELFAPELFAPGVISDANRQWRITFTRDEAVAYFAESEGFFPATRTATIHVSRLRSGQWTEPEVAPFSGRFSDIDPFITPDGSRLYFSSIRPVDGVTRGDIDLWYLERTTSGWSEPRRLGPEVNGPSDELYPSAAANGDLYFGVGPAAPNAESDWDIYVARRTGDGLAPRERLAAVSTDLPFDAGNPTADWEFNPEISADGRTLVFASLRPGGHGLGDLYVSHRRDGRWTPPQNLGSPVNTRWDEYHPTLSPRGDHLYFARTLPASQSSTSGDFYRISVASVPALRRGAR